MKLLSHLLIGGAAVVIGNGGGAEAKRELAMHTFFDLEKVEHRTVDSLQALQKECITRGHLGLQFFQILSPSPIIPDSSKYVIGSLFATSSFDKYAGPRHFPFITNGFSKGQVYCYDEDYFTTVTMLEDIMIEGEDNKQVHYYKYQQEILRTWGFLKNLLRSRHPDTEEACVVFPPIQMESESKWLFGDKPTKEKYLPLKDYKLPVSADAEAFSIPRGPTEIGTARGEALRGLTDVDQYLMMDVGYQGASLLKITKTIGTANSVKLEGAKDKTQAAVQNGGYEIIRVVVYSKEDCILILEKKPVPTRPEDERASRRRSNSKSRVTRRDA